MDMESPDREEVHSVMVTLHTCAVAHGVISVPQGFLLGNG